MTLLYKRKKLLYFAANLKDLPKIADFKVEVDKFLSNFYNFFMNQHIVHALHTYILVVSVANPVPHLFHIIMGIIRCRIQIPTKDSCLRIRILWIQKWIRMFVVFNIYFSIVKNCIFFLAIGVYLHSPLCRGLFETIRSGPDSDLDPYQDWKDPQPCICIQKTAAQKR